MRRLITDEGFWPRLVVADSGNHGLVEVDINKGKVSAIQGIARC